MNHIPNIWALVYIAATGSVIGLFKGEVARRKWVFKTSKSFQEKHQLAEKKKLRQSGGVALDDIELAAFHR